VLLTRLYLRNFRVYEEPVDLTLPPGLVGIYGVNGAGKSTLLEAIVFSLWGKARTGKDDVRTSGVGGDCVAEVEFEHEGHLYLVRRTLSGINASAKAQAHCDHLLMSEGVRDTSRYVHQVLGMDDAAFRASVFAEQKQLAAFSNQTPAERRRLVLSLLGITPLDSARDAVRKDAREARDRHERLRSLLPDLALLRVQADDAVATAAAAATIAASEEAVAGKAKAQAAAAEEGFAAVDRLRQDYDRMVLEGKAARSELNNIQAALLQLEAELADLDRAAIELADASPGTDDLAQLEVEVRLVGAVVVAAEAVDAVDPGAEPARPDGPSLDEARERAEAARTRMAGVTGQLEAVRAELGRARQQAELTLGLSGEEACPLCGQELGTAFEQVRSHRAAEVTEAEGRLQDIESQGRIAAAEAGEAVAALETLTASVNRAEQARVVWERAQARRLDAEAILGRAYDELLASNANWLHPAGPADPRSLADELTRLQGQLDAGRAAAAVVERLRGRLERRPVVVERLERTREQVGAAELKLITLLDQVKALGFHADQLAAARVKRDEALTSAERADRQARSARLTAEREETRAEGAAQRLSDGEAQHAKLSELAGEAVHLGRAAELLSSFRNTVVATVGPRLAVQAAELFGELTDHEYDRLEVDPETYELQVRDGGRLFGMDRLSGSEIDLANLALRVAISEHVRFQSGGSVGLLVLDEIFGPLDEDRKARMLLALERLRGRFRQILVVTHASDIKEQLPNAVEVIKLPGRRATARPLYA
jgi:exonuclease SbcC